MKFAILFLASLALISCASTNGTKIDDLAKITDGSKAYVVVKIDNKTGQELLASHGRPELRLRRSMVNPSEAVLKMEQAGSPYLVYEVRPGTYQIQSFRVQEESLLSHRLYEFTLKNALSSFFKVGKGEIIYLGSFTLSGKDFSLNVDYDPEKVKEELVTKYPTLDGFHWTGIADDRPSF